MRQNQLLDINLILSQDADQIAFILQQREGVASQLTFIFNFLK